VPLPERLTVGDYPTCWRLEPTDAITQDRELAAELARRWNAHTNLVEACKDALAEIEKFHRERQNRIDQIQDEWNHRHADDINLTHIEGIFCGLEIEEPPILAVLRAALKAGWVRQHP
jgi:hypothetical protein